jgi:Na+/H+-dicarboxylate symporter
MSQKSKVGKFITFGSLAAVLVGIACGVAVKEYQLSVFYDWSPYVEVFGKLWVVLLLLLIIPIAGSYIIYVFIAISSTREIGKLGLTSIGIHSINLLIGVAIGLGLGYVSIRLLINQIPVFSDTSYASGLLEGIKQGSGATVSHFLTFLNSSQVFLGKVVMFFIFFSIAFALIVSGIKWKLKNRIQNRAKKISEYSFNLLDKFLYTLPLAVFCLLYVFALKEGLFTAGAAAYLIGILSVLTLLLFFLQYLLVACCGIVSVKHFFKALIPAQIIAMSTRSSLATMPALLDCAEKRIGLPESTSGIIIPFFVTAFRVNYSISTTFGIIFLAHIFQVELSASTIIVFTLAQLLISFGSPGIPSGGHYFNVALYLSAGIPIEGVLMMKAIDHIPDIFKTLLNVTEVMSVTTVVAKIGKLKVNKPG